MFGVTQVVTQVAGGVAVWKSDHGSESGWRNDIPALLYQHIVATLLNVMQKRISDEPGFNVEEITGESGHSPFSIEEWHDVIGEVYVKFVTNGDPNEQAIVYRTTATKRNRYLGQYCTFNHHPNPILTVPVHNRRAPVVSPEDDKKGRTNPSRFWSSLCVVKHRFSMSDGTVKQFNISLSAVLVGSLLLKLEPKLFCDGSTPNDDGTVNTKVSVTVSAEHIKTIYGSQITPEHRVSDLFPNFNHFKDFVKNTEKNVWKFKQSPFGGMKEVEKIQQMERVSVCLNFKIDPNSDVITAEIDATTKRVIQERKLLPILHQGLLAMNSRYVHFLMSLRVMYDLAILGNCKEEGEGSTTMTHRKASEEVATLWRQHDFVLHGDLFPSADDDESSWGNSTFQDNF
jgi:hypothetical protein